jgi:DNA-binding response OmpR family regulator
MTSPQDYHPMILVVEDTEATRELLYDLFTEEGYQVMLAEDGAAAMTALAEVRPDLVTLDLELPGINGTQVLELMRQDEQLQAIAVVIVSGLDPIPERATELARAVIHKPFQLDDLLATVRRFVPPPEDDIENGAAPK